jgi:hypothetical protein
MVPAWVSVLCNDFFQCTFANYHVKTRSALNLMKENTAQGGNA